MTNKERMLAIMAAMEAGSLERLFAAMADDITWRWMGVEQWSRAFEGKETILGELFGGVAETLSSSFGVEIHNVLADGDWVLVEHSGRNQTPDGRSYNNNYCWLCRFEGGRIREIGAYMDTLLASQTFGTHKQA